MPKPALSEIQLAILTMLHGCPNGATADMLAIHRLFHHDAIVDLGRRGLLSMRATIINDHRQTVHFRITDEGRRRIAPNRKDSTRAWRG
jgi:hypothetical protein